MTDESAERFLAYPEQVREAARKLLARCRSGYTADVLPELARLIAGPTPDTLAEHVPVTDDSGYPVFCSCDPHCVRQPFTRDPDGNRVKDGEPARRWAAHVLEAIRV